jgi:hypothetical protein
MRVLDFLAEHGFDASKVQLLAAEDQPRAMALVRQMQVAAATGLPRLELIPISQASAEQRAGRAGR